jgi:purine-binding chemotaxis protein CheW
MEALFFSTCGSTFAAPLASLEEVLMPATLRPLPATPPWLLGLLNLRGAGLPVIDLRAHLGLPPRTGFERMNRILRVTVQGHDLGIVVDAVLRIAVLDEAARREPPRAGRDQGPLWQVDDELIQELRLDHVLDSDGLAALGWSHGGPRSDGNGLPGQAAGADGSAVP